MKKSVAIISSGYFPLPPVLGGAVENLIDLIAKENENYGEINLHIYSCYNENAFYEARKYNNTKFEFIKIPFFIQMIDKMIYGVAKNVLKVKKNMSYRYIVQRIYYINQVAKSIKKNEFDRVVIENHTTLLSILDKYKNDVKYKDKYYYHAHNLITNDFGNKKYLGKCRAIISVSQFISDEICKHLKNEYLPEYRVLKNKIDETRFISKNDNVRVKLREKYGIHPEEVVLMFSGRLNPEKGILELIKAFKKTNYLNSKLIICGSYYFGSKMKSDYEAELEKYAVELGQKIIFTGYINYENIPDYYQMADIVVAPSMWDEPALLVGIEAISAGKPLITTNAGGIPEYVDQDTAYIISKDGDVINALAKAIDRLVEDEQLRREYSDRAKKARKYLTKKTYYEDFIKAIDL